MSATLSTFLGEAGGAVSTLTALISGAPPGSWLSQLQPASYRGLPFAVRREEISRGRRTAPHTYAKRPDVWGEDMGRAARPFGITGFVVGDDCYAQARALIAAAEAPGAGTLVHPWLGTFRVAQTQPVRLGTRAELGRVVELQFEFIESTDPVYPSTASSTQAQVATAAANTQAAAASDFAKSTGGGSATAAEASIVDQPTVTTLPTTYTDANGTAVNLGGTLPSSSVYQPAAAVGTTQQFGDTTVSLGNDPSLIAGSTAGLQPPAGMTYGRYASGATITPQPAGTTVSDAISTTSANQAAVASSAQAAAVAAGGSSSSFSETLGSGGFGGL